MSSPAKLAEQKLARGEIPPSPYAEVSKLTKPVGPVKSVEPSLTCLMAAFLGLPLGTSMEALARHIATRLQEEPKPG